MGVPGRWNILCSINYKATGKYIVPVVFFSTKMEVRENEQNERNFKSQWQRRDDDYLLYA